MRGYAELVRRKLETPADRNCLAVREARWLLARRMKARTTDRDVFRRRKLCMGTSEGLVGESFQRGRQEGYIRAGRDRGT